MVAASATAFPGTYASTDNVWVQFYPTLRKEAAAVLRLGFVAEAADFLTTHVRHFCLGTTARGVYLLVVEIMPTSPSICIGGRSHFS
jgi:hypothetical protein